VINFKAQVQLANATGDFTLHINM